MLSIPASLISVILAAQAIAVSDTPENAQAAHSSVRMVDVNGDGLLDILSSAPDGSLRIELNLGGRVAECTADNIFILKDSKLKTPRLTEGALPGVTRGAVLELASQAGIVQRETVLGMHDLYNAEECFLTGTGAEIVPVISVDGRQIGDGRPGERTLRLLDAFRKLRVADGVKVDYPAQATQAQ